jgi:hypothetical protein
MIDTILLIAAAICFAAAALGINARINLVAVGLLALTLVQLL